MNGQVYEWVYANKRVLPYPFFSKKNFDTPNLGLLVVGSDSFGQAFSLILPCFYSQGEESAYSSKSRTFLLKLKVLCKTK